MLKRVTSWQGHLRVNKSQSKENAEIIQANCICLNWHSAKIIWIQGWRENLRIVIKLSNLL